MRYYDNEDDFGFSETPEGLAKAFWEQQTKTALENMVTFMGSFPSRPKVEPHNPNDLMLSAEDKKLLAGMKIKP